MTTPSDDGAVRPSAGAAGTHAPDRKARVSDAVLVEVTEALSELDQEAARSWTEERLGRAEGRVRNPDAYIRQALDNELASRKRSEKRKAKAESSAKPTRRNKQRAASPPAPCSDCDFVAKSKSGLSAHRLARHGVDCPECHLRYLRENIEGHRAFMHTKRTEPRPNPTPPVTPPAAVPLPVAPQRIVCQHCGQAYLPKYVSDHIGGACMQPPVTPIPVAPMPREGSWEEGGWEPL
jgi:hypothetical protein